MLFHSGHPKHREMFEFAGRGLQLDHLWQRTILVVIFSTVFGLIGPAIRLGLADESSAPFSLTHLESQKIPFFLTDIPPQAQHLVPPLHHIIEISESITSAQGGLKQLRTDLDVVFTHLISLKSELEVVTQRRSDREQELARLETEATKGFEALKFDLDNKLEQELDRSREQVSEELKRELAVRFEAYEKRQRETVQKTLSQELLFEDRELQQLTKEIEVQSQELSDRLIKLDDRSNLAKTLKHTTKKLLAKKRAELQERRSRLNVERDVVLARQRQSVVQVLKEQKQVQLQRRLTIKEASLRLSMAALLVRTRKDMKTKIEDAREVVSTVNKRYGRLVEDFASLTAQQKSLEIRIATQLRAMEGLEIERQASLVRLEEAFRKRDGELAQDAISWFGGAIQSAPRGLSLDLEMMHQRLVKTEKQERRLQEQGRILRERQLALQVSREMEAQYQRIQEKQRRKEQAKFDKAEKLLRSAGKYANNGNYDKALQIISQAQALNPPQIQRIAMTREEFIVKQDRVVHTRQSAEIERLFEQAMKIFEEGRYGDAVAMFEQVIDQEASMGQSLGQLARDLNP